MPKDSQVHEFELYIYDAGTASNQKLISTLKGARLGSETTTVKLRIIDLHSPPADIDESVKVTPTLLKRDGKIHKKVIGDILSSEWVKTYFAVGQEKQDPTENNRENL